jgi:hypothetical protein
VNTGDLVVRSYTWPSLTIGIIVEMFEEEVELDEGASSGSFYYTQIKFVIAWMDGSISTEMIEELEHLKDSTDNNNIIAALNIS